MYLAKAVKGRALLACDIVSEPLKLNDPCRKLDYAILSHSLRPSECAYVLKMPKYDVTLCHFSFGFHICFFSLRLGHISALASSTQFTTEMPLRYSRWRRLNMKLCFVNLIHRGRAHCALRSPFSNTLATLPGEGLLRESLRFVCWGRHTIESRYALLAGEGCYRGLLRYSNRGCCLFKPIC